MVSNCANPQCNKQLHYLRDGKVYRFDTSRAAPDGKAAPKHNEHFWLCGDCIRTLSLEPASDGVRVVHRPIRARSTMSPIQGSMAS